MESKINPKEKITNMKAQQIQKYLKLKKVLILGEIGHGKSSTCQSISDFEGDYFKVSSGKDACTTETSYHICKWKNTQDQFILIDTPGFNEGDEQDEININNMIIRLQQCEKIDAIFIVMNGQIPRISSGIKKMLKQFYSIFEKDFLSHIAFIITRWSYKEDDIEDRKDQNATEERKIDDINQQLLEQEIRQQADVHVQCFFVNNLVGMNKNPNKKISKHEIEMHQVFLQQVRTQVECLEPFCCKALNNLILQKESLRIQIQKQMSMWEKEKINLQKVIKEYDQYVNLILFKFETFEFPNVLGNCLNCQLLQRNCNEQNYCSQCQTFFEQMHKNNRDYTEKIIENFKILLPSDQYFPQPSGIIKNLTYYYSSLVENQDLDNFFDRLGNGFAKITGSWFLHSFIVIDYQDKNKEGKFSLEFCKYGFFMRFEERIFEDRYQYRDYYKLEGKQQQIGELMEFCAQYSTQFKQYKTFINNCQSFSNAIWKQFEK